MSNCDYTQATIDGTAYTLKWRCCYQGRSYFEIHQGGRVINRDVVDHWDGTVSNGFVPYPKHSIERRLVARWHWMTRRVRRSARYPERVYRRLGAVA